MHGGVTGALRYTATPDTATSLSLYILQYSAVLEKIGFWAVEVHSIGDYMYLTAWAVRNMNIMIIKYTIVHPRPKISLQYYI